MINDLLKKIKEAIYGEEVRNSIHDAIEQCYKDATGHPESVAAAVKEIGEVSANLSKETADRKTEVNTERKRIDNLIVNGTAQTQEIGKVIATTSENGAKITMDYLSEEVTCKKVFTDVTFQDFNFFIVALGTPKGDVAKILKPGLYHMKFCVKVGKDSGLPEIPMKIMLNSSTSPDKGYVILKREYFVFPQTESKRNMRNVEFVFAITEPTYITISVISVADGQGTFDFSISDCAITALDWKGKQSADLSELHDLRIGADGTVYDTAGEAVRSQTSGTPKNLIPTSTKEFEALGITVKVKGHEFSLSGTATDNGTIRLINETTDTLGMITGKTYYVYGFPSGTRVTFLSGENVCGTMVLADTDNTFEVPEKADRLWLEVIVKYKDALNYINTLKICDREYKTYQEQIDEANAKIEALQAIITAPTLTADTNGNLQIAENEEG